jgi:hypothetical protein
MEARLNSVAMPGVGQRDESETGAQQINPESIRVNPGSV